MCARLVLFSAAIFATLGCGGGGAARRPSEVLEDFLAAMDRSASSDGARRDAYALLDASARKGLAQRAAQAELVAGRDFEPWQMLAPGRFRLRFAPAEHHGMREQVSGDEAVVHVVSSDGKSRAQVPLVREQGRWRVRLSLPPPREP